MLMMTFESLSFGTNLPDDIYSTVLKTLLKLLIAVVKKVYHCECLLWHKFMLWQHLQLNITYTIKSFNISADQR